MLLVIPMCELLLLLLSLALSCLIEPEHSTLGSLLPIVCRPLCRRLKYVPALVRQACPGGFQQRESSQRRSQQQHAYPSDGDAGAGDV